MANLNKLNLKGQSEYLEDIINHNKDILFKLNPDLTIHFLNQAFTELSGWLVDEWRDKYFLDLIHPEDHPSTRTIIKKILRNEDCSTFELRIRSKIGEYIIGECCYVLFFSNDIAPFLYLVFRDRTAEKRLVDRLRMSEEKNQILLRAIRDFTFRINRQGLFLEFISNQSEVFKRNTLEFIEKSIFELLPEVANQIALYLESAIVSHRTKVFEFQIEFNENKASIETYRARISPLSNDEALVFIRNITENKVIEQALLESETKYRYLVEQANDGICITQNGNLKYVNQQLARMLGYFIEEIEGSQITDFIPIDLTLKVLKLYKKHVTIQNNFFLFETILLHKNGNRITVELSGCLINYEGHRASLILVRDITKKKQIEDALIAEKERLAVTLRSIGDAVITTDTQGRIVLMNPVAEILTGWTYKNAAGKPLDQVFYIMNDKTSEPCGNIAESVFKLGNIVGLEPNTVLVSKDGLERFISASCAPIRYKKQIQGVVLVFRDITGRQKMEEEILKTQKLESLGILAGGIAHDFNNILAGILANAQLIKLMFAKGLDITKNIEGIQEATLRASGLTKQLLTFSKGGAPVKKVASVADLIRDTVDFAVRGSNVFPFIEIPDNLWPVEADEGQMSQVINNLVINAIQAMPTGGIVKVNAQNIIVNIPNNLPLKPGYYIKIVIQDQGVGIPEENLSKIFDPYFTTKVNGNGLGLTSSYWVIKKHEGHIEVKSEEGMGTSFYIYLPASDQLNLSTPKLEENSILKGEGKILFMDDEPIIKDVIGEMLSQIGYQVSYARNGNEVVQLYQEAKECGEPYAAVIMDLTIPGGMGGKETISKLKMIDPNVKAIVSSGYFNDPVMANYKDYGFSDVVVKPYKIQELNATLNKVLYRPLPESIFGQ